MDIGQTIKRLRKERNFTQEELAEQLNITAQAVSKWENGVAAPDISQLAPLVSVFGVSADALLGIDNTSEDAEVKRLYDEAFAGTEVYDALEVVLRQFPNNFWLLDNSVGYLCNLAQDYYTENHPRAAEVFDECTRVANVIINFDRNAGHVARARFCLADLHLTYKQFGKAAEHANAIPKVWNPAHSMLAQIKQASGDLDGAIEGYRNWLRYILNDFDNAVKLLGGAYREKGQYEDEKRVYDALKGVCDAL
ncbi:MAG: helix-turn-helix domain-containing protein [Oscillospiraceae bacterium]|jgi:transcriptional regulator with XRE-family HTH domain|nr:helix-turn-helix domain-containing protein [Oscillospiraceae bacterium]